jgi:hypothetical protein
MSVHIPLDTSSILQLPQVLSAKESLKTSNVVSFTVSATDLIRAVLLNLGLVLTASEVPMRWIQGDTPPHQDTAPSEFDTSYLVYLTDSPGTFVLDGKSFPITANTGFAFQEGLVHETKGTGTTPRLLLGPMNELGNPVGITYIFYFTNYSDAYNKVYGNSIANNGINDILGYYNSGSIGSYTSWRVASLSYDVSYPFSVPTGVYTNGFDMATLCPAGGAPSTTFFVYPSLPCFLEGTKLLCLVDDVETYVPIERIQVGTLVKTSKHGYKKAALIKKGSIQNPDDDERTENRLYKCSPTVYDELKDDLYITGCHSILVDTLTSEQREKTVAQLSKVFVTDKKYRLMACIDERAVPWKSGGLYTIWHIALEDEDERASHGIYAEGLLVESCSLVFLKGKSNMA